jgi:hypothetical protein
MTAEIKKYGTRNWAVYLILPDKTEELICVTVYKRGAESVLAMANALIAHN